MKKIYSLMALMLIASIAFSQTKEHPHEVRVGFGVQDSYGPFNGPNFPYGIWNTDNLDYTGQIRYSKYINEFLDWGINVTGSDIENMYDNDFSSNPLNVGSVLDLDVIAKYKFYNGVDIENVDALIKPYIYTGLAGTYISSLDNVRNVDNGLGMNVPIGAGLKVNFSEKVNLDLNGAFRVGLFDKIPNRWEHTAGLSFNLGSPKAEPVVIEEVLEVPPPPPADSDNDGIIDIEDDCPNEKGIARLNGCPKPPVVDTDGDGIVDEEDDCPNEKGIARLNGCPEPVIVDTDGDGIVDKDDKCPTIAGVKEHDGCLPPPPPAPVVVDTDGDGIVDTADNCPNVYGVASHNGCPKPAPVVVDSDGDGIVDSNDRCPNVVGVPENSGCPRQIITETVQAQIDNISKNIFFETGSATLKASSKAKLDELLAIMRDYNNYNLSIEGHTDNTGSASLNQTLSEKRAASVRNYLIARGVDSNRVSSAGYGENRPIATNDTAEGRRQNRRVELKLTLRR